MDNSKRTKCEVWSRTMGYYAPVKTADGGSRWNIGKRSEHYSRAHFDMEQSMHSLEAVESNKAFCDKF